MTPNKELTNNTIRLGLIGNPVTHSKSPALFRAAYPQFAPAPSFSYELIEAKTLIQGMERFFGEEFHGANITSPYKEEIFQYITHPDKISSLLGSANIILRGPQDEIHSYNSDYSGVKETILQLLSGEMARNEAWTLPQTELCRAFKQKKQKTALVIGTGGAGKAAALALHDLGITVFLANRTPEKAVRFASLLNRTSENLSGPPRGISLTQIPNYLPQCDLVIHALSIPLPELSANALKGKIVFEANYRCPYLAQSPSCTENSSIYLSGKYWLYNQAVPAFRLFTGLEPDRARMWKEF